VLKSRNQSLWILFISCFAFLFFIMMCAPPASDDLEFSALHFESFADFMSYVLYYGNGRVMGNISAISLNLYPTAGALIKSFVLTAIVFLLPAVLGLKGTSSYLLSLLLVLGIDSNLFGEVYAWTCGFANYIPPVVISLSVVYLLQRYGTLRYTTVKCLICGYICLMGFASQFFVEHSSGVNVLMAACAVILAWMHPKWRAIRLPAVLWLIVTVLGICGMFLVPKIFFVAGNRAEGYQTFNLSGLVEMIYSCVRNGIRLGNFYLGTPALIVSGGAFLTIYLGRNSRREKLTSVLYTVNFAAFAYLLLMTLMTVDHWNGRHAMIHHAVSTLFVMIPFVVWFAAVIGLPSRLLQGKLLFLLTFAIISLAPLLVVSPTPNRLIFQSYVFVALAALLCVSEVPELNDEVIQKRFMTGCASISLVLCLMIGLIYMHSKDMADLRERHILSQMEAGAREIEVFAIPYDYVFWDGDWFFTYYYYYEEPGDTHFTVLELDPWGIKYLENSET